MKFADSLNVKRVGKELFSQNFRLSLAKLPEKPLVKTRPMSVKVFRDNTVFVNEEFANGRGLFSVFSRALVQVPESKVETPVSDHPKCQA